MLKEFCAASHGTEEWEHVNNSSADTHISKEGGGRHAPGTRAGRGLPVACGEDHGEEIVPLQHTEITSGVEIHLVAHRGSPTGAGGCALKEAAAGGEPRLEQVFPTLKQRKSEKGTANIKNYESTARPIPLPSAPLGGGSWKVGSTDEPGKKGEMRGRYF